MYRGEAASDMNNYLITGMWRVAGQVSNCPNTTCYWGTLIVFKTGVYVHQVYIGNYTTSNGRMFLRTHAGSTFNSWEKIF